MENLPDSKTRSGKKLGTAATKRKRAESEDGCPVKNKKKMVDSISEKLDSMKAFFSDELKKSKNEIMADHRESIGVVSRGLEKTQADLDQHKLRMEEEIRRINASINPEAAGTERGNILSSYAGALRSTKATNAAASTRYSSQDRDQYWRARASARLAPVEGENEKELWAGLQKFLSDYMRIPRSEIGEKDIQHVRRVRVARGKKARLEVIVRFTDVETRDHVASYAKNLGDFIVQGKPTATFRHEIPTYLSGVHKTFIQYGYLMVTKHGRGLKRNMRFDDVTQSLCIDIKMPSSSSWITIVLYCIVLYRLFRLYKHCKTILRVFII